MFQVAPLPDGGTRVVLPLRSPGLFGAVPLIVGAGLLGSSLFLVDAAELKDAPLFYWVFVVGFRAMGSLAIVTGILNLLGRAVIEIRGNNLRAMTRLLGFGWWRSLSGVKRVEAVRQDGDLEPPLGDLEARDAALGCLILASNHDLRLLNAVAAELTRRLPSVAAQQGR